MAIAPKRSKISQNLKKFWPRGALLFDFPLGKDIFWDYLKKVICVKFWTKDHIHFLRASIISVQLSLAFVIAFEIEYHIIAFLRKSRLVVNSRSYSVSVSWPFGENRRRLFWWGQAILIVHSFVCDFCFSASGVPYVTVWYMSDTQKRNQSTVGYNCRRT